jgi:hypothetical protein
MVRYAAHVISFTMACFMAGAVAAGGCTSAQGDAALRTARDVCVAIESYDPDAGVVLRVNIPIDYYRKDGGLK